jgi:hypothetical protein
MPANTSNIYSVQRWRFPKPDEAAGSWQVGVRRVYHSLTNCSARRVAYEKLSHRVSVPTDVVDRLQPRKILTGQRLQAHP